LFDYHDFIC
jgi:hypothetical protein